MNRFQKIVSLYPLLLLIVILSSCNKGNNVKVTYVNQTSLPVNMYVSGNMCTNENMVFDRSMRKEEFRVNGKKNAEEFEVAVNNQVLVRKSLQWKAGSKEIMVVYNGSDLMVTY
jgi:hypothetical protein